MAQEIQAGAVIPQSENFAQDAVAFGFRHPLAIQDPRGQMALNVLGKAHGEWRQGQLAQQRINPYRSMAGGGIYNASTGEVTVEPSTRPVSVPRNSRLVNPDTKEVIVEPEALPDKPFNLAPGATRYDAQGNPIVTAPGRTGAGGLTPYQEEMQKRAATTRRMNVVKSKLTQTRDDIKTLEKRYLDLNEEESKLNPKKTDHLPKLQKIYDFRKEVGTRLQQLGKEREKLQQDFERVASGEDIEEEGIIGPVQPAVGVVPSSTLPGAPAVQQMAPAEPSLITEPVVQIKIKKDPKTGKRYEVDLSTNKVIREVP